MPRIHWSFEPDINWKELIRSFYFFLEGKGYANQQQQQQTIDDHHPLRGIFNLLHKYFYYQQPR
ncbi:uncharacterized protein LOC142241159 isoform X2 [Haematobia irritans]|uniref:uncharacterized protein LOC142241159 isoform X2 n=1 Tax=Haematobia irritans TaxID=7368 RepID=UPI003F50203C